MKNKVKIIIILILSIIIAFVGGYFIYENNKSYHNNSLSFKYAILDNNVILEKDVSEWIKKQSSTPGVYSMKFNNNEYALITQGKELNNICLENLLENSRSIKIEYSFIKSEKNANVKPMIIELDNTDKNIIFVKK
ncbi:hypothetical protein BFS06_12410 [Clostridium perfringens]|uniref:Uncharacterized protein n=1 Tax=Clostridium perfringens TaxID=1502 RepID=A0A140GR49_CLOPF|nr:hypothetical protein [Clostridium perfringens]AMN31008.1 hypothetical protein JFP838_pA0092 [Clostridium perfringens]TBX15004.1 hypothetical protein BFS06_12410 [Clostridium perfringens]